MWSTTVTCDMDKKLSTTQTPMQRKMQEQLKNYLKRQLPDMPRTTCLLWGWENFHILYFYYFSLGSGFPEGPLLPEDDSGPEDVGEQFLRFSWGVARSLYWAFRHVGARDLLPCHPFLCRNLQGKGDVPWALWVVKNVVQKFSQNFFLKNTSSLWAPL